MSQQIAIPAGAGAEQFAVQVHHGIYPNGDLYVCDSVISRGALVYLSAQGVCTPVVASLPSTVVYLGFLEQNVVASTGIQLQFGYDALQKTGSQAGDPVAIWQFGRFYVVNVVGVFAAGDPVYPAAGGGIAATQTGSSPRVGRCIVGNASSSGKPVVVEINLFGF